MANTIEPNRILLYDLKNNRPLLDYYTGIKMSDAKNQNIKKFWFWLSVSVNLGFLGVFKYYNFFATSFADVIANCGFQVNPWTLKVILPVGISFYTFHGLSYVIDIYKDRIKAEKNFIEYSVFVSFFPLLVAGPIERANHLLPQIQKKRTFDYIKAVDGLRQILWGLFKKLVIADRLALYIDAVYGNSAHHNGTSLLMAAILFIFQLYCDFSGYCDIGIGAARVMGFKLMDNFNYPFRSLSISEFWRRWHISLSTWFNDYLFNPIVVNKRDWGKWAVIFGLMITFSISGLWHGSSWNFVFWGFMYGIVLSYEVLTKKWRKKMFSHLPPVLNTIISMFFVYAFWVLNWIFFRVPSINDCFGIIQKIFTQQGTLFYDSSLLYAVFGIGMLLLIEWKQKSTDISESKVFNIPNVFLRYSFLSFLTISILVAGVFDGGQFIYFQF
jgi:D-alanyl-lipoteichoic acid acyltransferase DltB (MBOAT superfamily)